MATAAMTARAATSRNSIPAMAQHECLRCAHRKHLRLIAAYCDGRAAAAAPYSHKGRRGQLLQLLQLNTPSRRIRAATLRRPAAAPARMRPSLLRLVAAMAARCTASRCSSLQLLHLLHLLQLNIPLV